MARRIFSRDFKVEAVRLVRERGVSVAQAARDLDVHENMLRRWAMRFVAVKLLDFRMSSTKPDRRPNTPISQKIGW